MNLRFAPFILLMCLSFGLVTSGFAQYTISGRVQQHNSEDLIAAFVSVSLSSDTNQVVQVATTDEEGRFSLAVQKEMYMLSISYWGQTLYRQTLSVDQSVDLGILKVEDIQTKELDAVQVKGMRPGLRMEEGKLIFSPQNVSAGSVFDLLKVVPMLSVVDDAITIVGKGAANVMINGKWQRMDPGQLALYLKSLPAQQIEKIEIIKNPSAALDAESRNGYINIVLKGNRDKGIMGTGSLTLSHAKYFSQQADVNLNANFGKWQMNATLGFANRKSWMYGTNDIYFVAQHWREDNTQIGKTQAPSLALGVDYAINKKQAIGASLLWNRSDRNNTEANKTQIYNQSVIADSSLLMSGVNPENMESYAWNLNYVYQFDTSGKKIRFDLDQFANRFDREQEFLYFNFDKDGIQTGMSNPYQSGNGQHMDITTANLGVDLPLSMATFSFGGKLTFIRNRNKTSFYEYSNHDWVPDPQRFDHFQYDENTQAVYIKAAKTIRQWSMMFGLRAENTQTKGWSEVYQTKALNQYFQLFPSADLSYNPNEQNAFSLNYARRIDRPQFGMVNPFRWYHSQYAYTHGNPSVQPYFSHNIELTYIYLQKWTGNLSYYRSRDAFSEIELTKLNTPLRETIVDNFLGYDLLSLNLSANHNLFGRWLLTPQLSLSHYNIKSTRAEVPDSKSFSGYASLYNQFSITKKKNLLLDLSGYYIFPNNAGVMQFRNTWSVSTGLTYRLLDNKLAMSLNANDLFKTGVMRYHSTVNTILRARYVYRDSRYLSLTLRYTFNSGKAKPKEETPKANQEEMNRI
ncbi:hypothetical protein DBR32_06680 [Taibaiella sp. KBW10]|uniref:TonB-dependent receptor n=1 Tax=Taibaiella sp. KBW10 TaxID=2153357 RepID=UPI000F5A3E8E|nr:TonB-dependent receptor [Taibaiella sp. KBW10]RQO31633.1 hypothetical protein DBR32_06680 [Taibaiella sp. KBW10]